MATCSVEYESMDIATGLAIRRPERELTVR